MLIISHLMGGLGNQMFQYAVGRRLQCMGDNRELRVFFEDGYKLAARKYLLDVFEGSVAIATAAELGRVGPERRLRRRIMLKLSMPIEKHVLREKRTFIYDPAVVAHNTDVYLIGFWQSYRYLDPIREQLLADFKLKTQSEPMQRAIQQIRASACSVAVHIRRADYLNPASGFAPLPLQYYRTALQLLKERLGSYNVFVFTDDATWAEKNISEIATVPVQVVSNAGLKDFEELTLMSCCQHNVIANSSFSWWGAWLNPGAQKIVMAPRYWNGINDDIPLHDLVPGNWDIVT